MVIHSFFYKYKDKLVILQPIGVIVIKSKETRMITYTKQRIMFQATLLALHLLKSHTKAITLVPQIVTHVARENTKENKGELR